MKQLLSTIHCTAARTTTADRDINGFVLRPPSTFLVISMVPERRWVNSLAFVTYIYVENAIVLAYSSTEAFTM